MQNGPLSISLNTKVKTSVPMFAENVWVKMRLKSIDQGATEKGDTIKFTWELVDPAPSVESAKGEGEPILPGKFGCTYFDTVFLYDKNSGPGEIPEQALKKIAQRQDAVLGTGDPGNKKGKPERPAFDAECAQQMFGKEAFLQFRVKTGEYEGNEIKALMYPGDAPKA